MDELRRRAQTLLDYPPVAPTPIPTLRRRALRRRTRFAAAAVVIVASAGALGFVAAADSSTSPRVTVTPTTTGTALPTIGAPATFVSTRGEPDTPTLTVALSDARTDKVLKTLLSIPNDGSTVTGTAIAANGDVWVTVDKGPSMLGHTDGGNPQPHTCASRVLDIDPRTGTSRTVLSGGDDELISDAQPSPTGDRVAYLHSGCATSFFGSALFVRDLTTGAIVSIGADLPNCHYIFSPRWTLDGRSLVVVYDKAVGTPYAGPEGTCNQAAAGVLAVVSAEHSQPGFEATEVGPQPVCAIDSVAVTSDGFAAVEHCSVPHSLYPEQLFIDGPVQLVRYDAKLRVVSRAPLGACEDGSSIGANLKSPTVVVSTYQYCGGGSNGPPTTKVFVQTGTGPARQIAALPLDSLAVNYVSF